MQKLTLESLDVQSFETLAPVALNRGTVRGNEDEDVSVNRICQITGNLECTASPEACGDTAYLDCTFACSDFESCQAC